MDRQVISTIAVATVGFIAPYLGKADETVGKKLDEEIYNMIKLQFSHIPVIQELLNNLEEAPDDPDLQAALRVLLEKLLKEDEPFALELQQAIKEAAGTEAGSTVIQQVAGDNAKLFGQVFGDVALSGPHGSGGGVND